MNPSVSHKLSTPGSCGASSEVTSSDLDGNVNSRNERSLICEVMVLSPDSVTCLNGIAVKHLVNIPFSSTLGLVLDLNEVNVPLSTEESYKLRQKMKSEVKTLGIHFAESLGLFRWETQESTVPLVCKKDLRILSSFTPAFGRDKTLKCFVNVQIQLKMKRSGKGMGMEYLPRKEMNIRKNLMISLAMILQNRTRLLIFMILEGRFRFKPPSLSTQMKRGGSFSKSKDAALEHGFKIQGGWKSYLKFRDLSFEEINSASSSSSLHKCTILPLKGPGWVKGFVLTRIVQSKLVPLLWAKWKTGIKNRFHLYEATDEKNLLGIVNLNPFGSRTIHEKLKVTNDSSRFKEIVTLNYSSRILRKGLKQPMVFPRCTDSATVQNHHEQRILCGEKRDFHLLKIYRPPKAKCGHEREPLKILMHIQNESGDVVLRIAKLDGFKYALEYKRPFDAFTAFSIALPQF